MNKVFKMILIFILCFDAFECFTQNILYEIDENHCTSTVYSMGASHYINVLVEGYNYDDIFLKSDSAVISKYKWRGFLLRSIKKSEGGLIVKIQDSNNIDIGEIYLNSTFPPAPSVFINNYTKNIRVANPEQFDSLQVYPNGDFEKQKFNFKIISFEASFMIDSHAIYKRNITGGYFSEEDIKQFKKLTKSKRDFVLIKDIKVSLEDMGYYIYYTIPYSRIDRFNLPDWER